MGSSDRPRLGEGPVELVVYSDFQCPACAVAAPVLSALAEEGSVTLVYRYFPLVSIHSNAEAAAEAAQAAAQQGRFWEFHDALFARQAAWADLAGSDAAVAFEAIAADIGLDVPRWQADAMSIGCRRRSSNTDLTSLRGAAALRNANHLRRRCSLRRGVEPRGHRAGGRFSRRDQLNLSERRAELGQALCEPAEHGRGLRDLSRDEPAHDEDRGPCMEQNVMSNTSLDHAPQRANAT